MRRAWRRKVARRKLQEGVQRRAAEGAALDAEREGEQAGSEDAGEGGPPARAGGAQGTSGPGLADASGQAAAEEASGHGGLFSAALSSLGGLATAATWFAMGGSIDYDRDDDDAMDDDEPGSGGQVADMLTSPARADFPADEDSFRLARSRSAETRTSRGSVVTDEGAYEYDVDLAAGSAMTTSVFFGGGAWADRSEPAKAGQGRHAEDARGSPERAVGKSWAGQPAGSGSGGGGAAVSRVLALHASPPPLAASLAVTIALAVVDSRRREESAAEELREGLRGTQSEAWACVERCCAESLASADDAAARRGSAALVLAAVLALLRRRAAVEGEARSQQATGGVAVQPSALLRTLSLVWTLGDGPTRDAVLGAARALVKDAPGAMGGSPLTSGWPALFGLLSCVGVSASLVPAPGRAATVAGAVAARLGPDSPGDGMSPAPSDGGGGGEEDEDEDGDEDEGTARTRGTVRPDASAGAALTAARAHRGTSGRGGKASSLQDRRTRARSLLAERLDLDRGDGDSASVTSCGTGASLSTAPAWKLRLVAPPALPASLDTSHVPVLPMPLRCDMAVEPVFASPRPIRCIVLPGAACSLAYVPPGPTMTDGEAATELDLAARMVRSALSVAQTALEEQGEQMSLAELRSGIGALVALASQDADANAALTAITYTWTVMDTAARKGSRARAEGGAAGLWAELVVGLSGLALGGSRAAGAESIAAAAAGHPRAPVPGTGLGRSQTLGLGSPRDDRSMTGGSGPAEPQEDEEFLRRVLPATRLEPDPRAVAALAAATDPASHEERLAAVLARAALSQRRRALRPGRPAGPGGSEGATVAGADALAAAGPAGLKAADHAPAPLAEATCPAASAGDAMSDDGHGSQSDGGSRSLAQQLGDASSPRCLSRLLAHPTRPDVRGSALQTLFSAVAAHCSSFDDALWQLVLATVALPLADEVTATATTAAEMNDASSGGDGGDGGAGRHDAASLTAAGLGAIASAGPAVLGRGRGGEAKAVARTDHKRESATAQWRETRVVCYQGLIRVVCAGFERLVHREWFHDVWSGLLALLERAVVGSAGDATPRDSLPGEEGFGQELGKARGAEEDRLREACQLEARSVTAAALVCVRELALLVCVPSGVSDAQGEERYSVGMRVVDGALMHVDDEEEEEEDDDESEEGDGADGEAEEEELGDAIGRGGSSGAGGGQGGSRNSSREPGDHAEALSREHGASGRASGSAGSADRPLSEQAASGEEGGRPGSGKLLPEGAGAAAVEPTQAAVAAAREALWRDVVAVLQGICRSRAALCDPSEAVCAPVVDTLRALLSSATHEASSREALAKYAASFERGVDPTSVLGTPRAGALLGLVSSLVIGRRRIRWARCQRPERSGDAADLVPEELRWPQADMMTAAERSAVTLVERVAGLLVVRTAARAAAPQAPAGRGSSPAEGGLPSSPGPVQPFVGSWVELLRLVLELADSDAGAGCMPALRGDETGVLTLPSAALSVGALSALERIVRRSGEHIPPAALASVFHSAVSSLASLLLRFRRSIEAARNVLGGLPVEPDTSSAVGSASRRRAAARAEARSRAAGGEAADGPGLDLAELLPPALSTEEWAAPAQAGAVQDAILPIHVWGVGAGGSFDAVIVSDAGRARRLLAKTKEAAAGVTRALAAVVARSAAGSGVAALRASQADPGPASADRLEERVTALCVALEGMAGLPPPSVDLDDSATLRATASAAASALCALDTAVSEASSPTGSAAPRSSRGLRSASGINGFFLREEPLLAFAAVEAAEQAGAFTDRRHVVAGHAPVPPLPPPRASGVMQPLLQLNADFAAADAGLAIRLSALREADVAAVAAAIGPGEPAQHASLLAAVSTTAFVTTHFAAECWGSRQQVGAAAWLGWPLPAAAIGTPPGSRPATESGGAASAVLDDVRSVAAGSFSPQAAQGAAPSPGAPGGAGAAAAVSRPAAAEAFVLAAIVDALLQQPASQEAALSLGVLRRVGRILAVGSLGLVAAGNAAGAHPTTGDAASASQATMSVGSHRRSFGRAALGRSLAFACSRFPAGAPSGAATGPPSRLGLVCVALSLRRLCELLWVFARTEETVMRSLTSGKQDPPGGKVAPAQLAKALVLDTTWAMLQVAPLAAAARRAAAVLRARRGAGPALLDHSALRRGVLALQDAVADTVTTAEPLVRHAAVPAIRSLGRTLTAWELPDEPADSGSA
ncbi:hypothetical protein FNF31_01988 [Cafeteria roenbergensis]|uniref:Mon2 C-terminal domain-containing protein n=1 Tax=Cafeteria roenbergensis TaxID=33653 RepID=A0A5A8DIU0_CAFRO|nr:hypothetical protein FNF31_01988 [Cafeteria roenbergensis]